MSCISWDTTAAACSLFKGAVVLGLVRWTVTGGGRGKLEREMGERDIESGGKDSSSLSSRILGRNGKAQDFEDHDLGAKK